jgi:hypothetical protein
MENIKKTVMFVMFKKGILCTISIDIFGRYSDATLTLLRRYSDYTYNVIFIIFCANFYPLKKMSH